MSNFLDKLAMEVSEWTAAGFHKAGLKNNDYEMLVDPHLEEQWLQRRKELINEPDDSTAPTWARWKTQDDDGTWFWHYLEPILGGWEWQQPWYGDFALGAQGKIPAGHDWRKTLKEVVRDQIVTTYTENTETNMDEIKDVKLAWAKGETVQYRFKGDDDWSDWLPKASIHIGRGEEWRVKPKTITIGTMEVPAPATMPLKYGTPYWIPLLFRRELYTKTLWTDNKWDELAIKHGMIHLSKENAIAHAKALILVSGGKLGESDD